jgi:hypothetical protein
LVYKKGGKITNNTVEKLRRYKRCGTKADYESAEMKLTQKYITTTEKDCETQMKPFVHS